jgi:hypothetical protein
MAARAPGDPPDPAAELLGRWQAHHSPDPAPPDSGPPTTQDDETTSTEEAPATDGTGGGRAVQRTAPEVSAAPATPETSGAGDAPDAVGTPRHAAPRTDARRRRTPPLHGADQVEAGREVVEALGISPPAVPQPEPAEEPGTAPAGARPVRTRSAPVVGTSADVEFAPRLLVRHVLAWLLLGSFVAAAVAVYVAYREPRTISVGVAGTLVVLTLALYGLRATATPARLAIRGGQLEVVRGSTREVFDLTSRFTRMEVVGRPGRRGWKVLMARFGRDPLVIDSSMVDPSAFTAALERHRPR